MPPSLPRFTDQHDFVQRLMTKSRYSPQCEATHPESGKQLYSEVNLETSQVVIRVSAGELALRAVDGISSDGRHCKNVLKTTSATLEGSGMFEYAKSGTF